MKQAETTLEIQALLALLLGVPLAYVLVSYGYLAIWHGQAWLWRTLIHENGRLTLAGSLFYFDHFLGTAPMAVMFALCVAGGCALSAERLPATQARRAGRVAVLLLLGAAVFFAAAFVASVRVAGWERTEDYLYQRIERDGVASKGGNWNQLQLSNFPIALGIVGACAALSTGRRGAGGRGHGVPSAGGLVAIGLAVGFSVGMAALNWAGWQVFLNPRWLAHSLREVATFPLTGVPLAVASVVLVEHAVSGARRWIVRVGMPSVLMLGAAVALVLGQLALLGQVDVLAMAQRPAFAPEGLSIPYLLASHVFEHALDFVFFGMLAGGVYAWLRARHVA